MLSFLLKSFPCGLPQSLSQKCLRLVGTPWARFPASLPQPRRPLDLCGVGCLLRAKPPAGTQFVSITHKASSNQCSPSKIFCRINIKASLFPNPFCYGFLKPSKRPLSYPSSVNACRHQLAFGSTKAGVHVLIQTSAVSEFCLVV